MTRMTGRGVEGFRRRCWCGHRFQVPLELIQPVEHVLHARRPLRLIAHMQIADELVQEGGNRPSLVEVLGGIVELLSFSELATAGEQAGHQLPQLFGIAAQRRQLATGKQDPPRLAIHQHVVRVDASMFLAAGVHRRERFNEGTNRAEHGAVGHRSASLQHGREQLTLLHVHRDQKEIFTFVQVVDSGHVLVAELAVLSRFARDSFPCSGLEERIPAKNLDEHVRLQAKVVRQPER